MNYKNKWNNYTPGEISWINDRMYHPSREYFVQWVFSEDIKSVLEIGAGECFEAKILKEHINYTVIDISDTFLEYAKKNNIQCKKGYMADIPFDDKSFDAVYMCSVLEHTDNIYKTIDELKRISNKYFITLFKWTYKDVSMESTFHDKRKYYSTEFNIDKIIELLESVSVIDQFKVAKESGEILDYCEYMKEYIKEKRHRNGNYACISGSWK